MEPNIHSNMCDWHNSNIANAVSPNWGFYDDLDGEDDNDFADLISY